MENALPPETLSRSLLRVPEYIDALESSNEKEKEVAVHVGHSREWISNIFYPMSTRLDRYSIKSPTYHVTKRRYTY